MDKNSVKRVVYDVYLTRNQNGNTELSKLDYSGRDYEIGEYIRNDRISISIRNISTSLAVKSALDLKPVHVAFYFDQSSYAIEFGPNNHNLYISPLSKTISLQRQIFQVICTSPRPTRILSISASTTVSLSSMSILSQSFIYPLMVSMFRFPYISADI